MRLTDVKLGAIPVFLISPGFGVPASRLMVGMRQWDSPAAPVSSTLPQDRVSGSTAVSVKGDEQKPELGGER